MTVASAPWTALHIKQDSFTCPLCESSFCFIIEQVKTCLKTQSMLLMMLQCELLLAADEKSGDLKSVGQMGSKI